MDDLAGCNETLRQQIALRYMVHGIHIPVDEMVITNGALEALNLCLMALARPGDAVVVESPTFYGALQSLEQRGLRAVEVATHPREGLDMQALAEALDRHKPKACWLMTNFQNPLGCLMPNRKKRDSVELLARHDTPLIEDDVYSELYFGASAPRPAKSFDTHGIVMHYSSFSKSLAPGYRIGWAAPGGYTQTVSRLKITSSLSASAPAQVAIAEYLRKGSFDRHLARLRQAMASQLHSMLEAIHANFPAGTRATRPTGGYFLWVEIPGEINALHIHRLACEMGISVAPGPMFSNQGQFANCLRINYGRPWNQKSELAIAALGCLLRAH